MQNKSTLYLKRADQTTVGLVQRVYCRILKLINCGNASKWVGFTNASPTKQGSSPLDGLVIKISNQKNFLFQPDLPPRAGVQSFQLDFYKINYNHFVNYGARSIIYAIVLESHSTLNTNISFLSMLTSV